ncbi:hypothetical protein AALT_g11255 [Alternaria alternata]|nr:hypothetical protein AALT_g11255 [Alternaria alternata]
MLLDTDALDVFVAIVPTFVASLPHAPARNKVETVPNTMSETALRTHNAIRTLRFEAYRLSESIPKDHTAYALSAADHKEATSALEDIFHLFLGCLDDPIDNTELREMTSTLRMFKDELALPSVPTLAYTPAPSDRIHWYGLRTNNSEATEYWAHTKVVNRFNDIMARVYAPAQPANSHSCGGSIPDRFSRVIDERETQLDMIAAMSASKKAIADVMLERHENCDGHPTYVHVSADIEEQHETMIETLIALIQSHWKADDLLVPPSMDMIDDTASNLEVYVDDVSNLTTNAPELTKHFVLEFGVLLWELFFLQEVEVLEEDRELNEEDSLYNALYRTYMDGTERCLQPACLIIINNCLSAYDDLEEGVAEAEIRASIYDKIFKPLQEFAATYSDISKPRPVLPHKCNATREGKEPIVEIQVDQIVRVESALQAACQYSYNDTASPAVDEGQLFSLDLANVLDENKSKLSDNWKRRIREQNLNYRIGRDPGPKIKIAILDTGIDKSHPQVIKEWYHEVKNNEGRIRGFKDFVHEDIPKDVSGHGTHIAGIILELSSNTHVYIGRIVESQKKLKHSSKTFRQRLAKALQHARKEWNVDIVSLSFGFSKTDEEDEIRKEIKACQNSGIVVFASASNDGGHKPRTYPGKYPGVLCIHSATAMGAASEFNPTPVLRKYNFMCVGEYVQSWWPKSIPTEGIDSNDGMKHMSGTSFATPVAISIAAFMIGYVRKNIPDHRWNVSPLSIEGIDDIFQLLSYGNKRDGYDFLSTENLFADHSESHISSLLIDKLDGRRRRTLLTSEGHGHG